MFQEDYTITPKMALTLMQIEATKGNESTPSFVSDGFNRALDRAIMWASKGFGISEKMMPTIHAIMSGDGKSKIVPSTYREGISESDLKLLVDWINKSLPDHPCQLVAAIAFKSFNFLKPFEDKEHSFARLITTLILHLGGYSTDFLATLDPEADIPQFLEAMVAKEEKFDKKQLYRELNERKRKALKLFKGYATISASQLGDQFDLKARTRAQLCKDWVEEGFLEIVDFSNKARKYKLSGKFQTLIT